MLISIMMITMRQMMIGHYRHVMTQQIGRDIDDIR